MPLRFHNRDGANHLQSGNRPNALIEPPINSMGLESQTAWKPDHGESTNCTECMSVPYQRAWQRRIFTVTIISIRQHELRHGNTALSAVSRHAVDPVERDEPALGTEVADVGIVTVQPLYRAAPRKGRAGL